MSEALQAMERRGRTRNHGWSLGDLPGLRWVWRRLPLGRRVRGRIVSADVHGMVVDLGDAQGIVPREELELDWLLTGPRPGRRFSGYVTAIEEPMVMLTPFGRRERRRRARRREAALAAMIAQLDEPGEREPVTGLVLTTGEQGALVALEDGLITGLVPALALESRPYVEPGRSLQFRVIGQPEDPRRKIDVLLWPQPAGAASG